MLQSIMSLSFAATAATYQMAHRGPSHMLLSVSLLIATFTIHEAAALAPDPGVMVPVVIRPAIAGEQLFIAQSLEPRFNITSCSIYPDKGQICQMCDVQQKLTWHTSDPNKLDCMTFYHNEYPYVDLEQLEPLFEGQRVLCDENAAVHKPTDVVLRFIGKDGFLLAKSVWGRGKDLIFMVEDPHCFHPDGSRSFYQSVESPLQWACSSTDALQFKRHPLGRRTEHSDDSHNASLCRHDYGKFSLG